MAGKDLTTRRHIFLTRLLASGDVALSAREAGYAVDGYGYQLLRDPNVAAELQILLQQAKAEDVTFARYVLHTIAGDKDQPGGARVTAARTLLEYAGAMQKAGDRGASKDPSEMTADELRGLITRLDRELGDRAKPVEGTESVPLPSEVVDMTS
jgi:phage terminase small subunit